MSDKPETLDDRALIALAKAIHALSMNPKVTDYTVMLDVAERLKLELAKVGAKVIV